MKQHAGLLAVLNGGIQSSGFTNAFLISWKRQSQEVRIHKQIISVLNGCCLWISPYDGFLTQELETSDHFKRNTGKTQLFHTGKESTWDVYIYFRDLHHPSVFLDRSGGDGRKIIASSRGAAYSKNPQSSVFNPLLAAAFLFCHVLLWNSCLQLWAHQAQCTQKLGDTEVMT